MRQGRDVLLEAPRELIEHLGAAGFCVRFKGCRLIGLLLGDQGILEDLHGTGHHADLVTAGCPLDHHAQIATGKRPHILHKPLDRLGDAASEAEGDEEEERCSAGNERQEKIAIGRSDHRKIVDIDAAADHPAPFVEVRCIGELRKRLRLVRFREEIGNEAAAGPTCIPDLLEECDTIGVLHRRVVLAFQGLAEGMHQHHRLVILDEEVFGPAVTQNAQRLGGALLRLVLGHLAPLRAGFEIGHDADGRFDKVLELGFFLLGQNRRDRDGAEDRKRNQGHDSCRDAGIEPTGNAGERTCQLV